VIKIIKLVSDAIISDLLSEMFPQLLILGAVPSPNPVLLHIRKKALRKPRAKNPSVIRKSVLLGSILQEPISKLENFFSYFGSVFTREV
jgi:hypothetical protein